MEAGGPEDENGKCHLRGHKIAFEAVEMLHITLNKYELGDECVIKEKEDPE